MEIAEIEHRCSTDKIIQEAYRKWQMARTCVVNASKDLQAVLRAEELARAEMEEAINLYSK